MNTTSMTNPAGDYRFMEVSGDLSGAHGAAKRKQAIEGLRVTGRLARSVVPGIIQESPAAVVRGLTKAFIHELALANPEDRLYRTLDQLGDYSDLDYVSAYNLARDAYNYSNNRYWDPDIKMFRDPAVHQRRRGSSPSLDLDRELTIALELANTRRGISIVSSRLRRRKRS